jgi:adenosylcobinamide-GDP ribazoletransferase
VQEIRLLLTAVQYFTRLPMPRWVGHGAAELTGTTRYFPAVGIAVGAVGAAVFWAASIVFPPVIAAILSTIATAVLTGALHEDGLADTLDGLGGGHTRERALEIMKDPRIGAFGALSLMLLLALKIAALSALPLSWIVATLIAGHAMSRWCAVLIVRRLPYARADSSTRARPVVERVASTDVVVATIFGLAPLIMWVAITLLATPNAPQSPGIAGAALAPGVLGPGLSTPLVAGSLAGLLGALAATGLLGRWYRRRLGGYTGDTLGATQQITEAVFYLAMLAAWNSR